MFRRANAMPYKRIGTRGVHSECTRSALGVHSECTPTSLTNPIGETEQDVILLVGDEVGVQTAVGVDFLEFHVPFVQRIVYEFDEVGSLLVDLGLVDIAELLHQAVRSLYRSVYRALEWDEGPGWRECERSCDGRRNLKSYAAVIVGLWG